MHCIGCTLAPILSEPFMTRRSLLQPPSDLPPPFERELAYLTNLEDRDFIYVAYAYWAVGLYVFVVVFLALVAFFFDPRHQDLRPMETQCPVVPCSGLVVVLFFYLFAAVAMEIIYSQLIAAFVLLLGHNKTVAAYVTSLFWAAFSTVRGVSIMWLKQRGSFSVLLCCNVFLVAVTGLNSVFGYQTRVMWIGTALAAACMAPVMPSTLLLLHDYSGVSVGKFTLAVFTVGVSSALAPLYLGAELESEPMLFHYTLAALAVLSLLLVLAGRTLGLCFCLPAPTLVELVDQTHSNYSRLSYIFAARSSGELLGSLIAGAKLTDETTLHKLRLLILLGACACPVLVIVIIQLGGYAGVAYLVSAASLVAASLLPFCCRRKQQRLEELAETGTTAPQTQRAQLKPSHEYFIRALGLSVLFLTSGSHLALGQLLGAFSATFSETGTVDSKLVTSLFYGSSLVVSAMAGVLRASSFWPLVVAQSGAVLGAILLTSLPGLWALHFLAAGLLGSSLSCALAFEPPMDAMRKIPTLRTTTQHMGEMLVCLVLGASLDDEDSRAFGIRTCVVVALALTLLLALWSTTVRRRRDTVAPPSDEARNDRREVDPATSVARPDGTTTWYVQETDPSINRNATAPEPPACVPTDKGGVRP
ncbi:hypothetical protein V5799_000556 [Amblyomma americanum]|uniref:Uncharacterized protein n=1 Tax=Amblyomma americanum TaxID=6943 RepID=A0AAQ4D2P7_AMBAM